MSQARTRLLDYLERRGYLNTPAVRAAMDSVDRTTFVPERQKYAAWDDTPLPIGRGQTISAPHMVAMMLEELQPRPGQRLLEVGAGCGYHAAVAAAMVAPEGEVHTVERIPQLVKLARANLAEVANVTVYHSDGSLGLPELAPFDRIMVTCGAPRLPEPLREQLAVRGRMVVPVGDRTLQELLVIEHDGDDWRETRQSGVAFVPLIGKHGYKD
jgi:protein-L-isoaspartate(D-aspartate) O-methyltransferase